MDSTFITTIQTLVTEQGKEALLNPAKCKALLADYTRGEYKKESRLLLQVLETGCQNAITESADLGAIKIKIAQKLQEEEYMSETFACDVVDLLGLVLRNDTTHIHIQQPGIPKVEIFEDFEDLGISLEEDCTSDVIPLPPLLPFPPKKNMTGVIIGVSSAVILLVVLAGVLISNANQALKQREQQAKLERVQIEQQGFVWIQGGTFMMGSPASEVARIDIIEGPQHQVTVSGFYMGKKELTVGEFRQFVNASAYKTTAETSGGGYVLTNNKWQNKADANWKNPYFSQNDNHPVVLVSWYDAVTYCNWRSQKEGLTPAYTVNGENVTWNKSANGYRLPTEAEWEYACRAGTTTPFNTGSNITTGEANYDGNFPYNRNAKGTYRGRTTDVGTFAANRWGLYDMHGNVYEWCWDWYGAYSSGAQNNPAGAVSGAYRVDRGGSWDFIAESLRSAFRNYGTPSYRGGDLGFRLVRP